jgi:hypothetical protein
MGLDSSAKLLCASLVVEPEGSLVTIAGTGIVEAPDTADPGPSALRASAMALVHRMRDGLEVE